MNSIDRFMRIFQLLIILGTCLSHINTEEDKHECWSSSTFYQISDFNNLEYNVTEIEFAESCYPSFLEKILNKTCPDSTSNPYSSVAQKYGYGFLSVFIISILSLAGFIAFPIMNKPYYKYINAFFIALAVGTLFADTVFELLPVIMKHDLKSTQGHEYDQIVSKKPSSKHLHVPVFLWQMTTLVLTAYVFYVIELIIHEFMHRRQHHKKNSFDLNHHELPPPETSVIPSLILSTASSNDKIDSINTSPDSTQTSGVPQTKSTGWVIIIGDGIHNVADGLAIGAAFAENTIFGITTAVAIACHELPTELGEYMVLIQSGFTLRRALLFNFISACTAIIGFFIGASIAQNEGARTWIFAVTAGTFAYIALVALWPTLMPETEKFDWIRFTCVTFGYVLGVFIMFILTIFEDQIVKNNE